MPTPILNPLAGNGPATKVCTRTGGTLGSPALKLGPDGPDWVIFSAIEVEGYLASVARVRHIGTAGLDHICSQYGKWAFRVFDGNGHLPHAVIFLHLVIPPKLQVEDGPTVYWFTGNDLVQSYRHALEGVRAPRVWRRTKFAGMDNQMTELAVNFCVKKHG